MDKYKQVSAELAAIRCEVCNRTIGEHVAELGPDTEGRWPVDSAGVEYGDPAEVDLGPLFNAVPEHS